LETFFFIPATKLHKINVLPLRLDQIIVDFEDAVAQSKREELITEIYKYDNYKECFLRIPLINEEDENSLDDSTLKKFLDRGFKKFVLPKLNSTNELNIILDIVSPFNTQLILLIETPRLYLDLMNNYPVYNNKFFGISLGSHDFIANVGAEYSLENLELVRHNILYIARSCNALSIDIASMELQNEKEFKNEVQDGFKKGFDAKFLIHPWQLEIIRNIKFYSKKEYQWALEVKKELEKVKKAEDFSPIVISGEVIERPHLAKMYKILKHFEI
jgi:citrate lyase beta subunit